MSLSSSAGEINIARKAKRQKQQQARRAEQVQRKSPRLAARQEADRVAKLEKYKPRALFKGKGKALSPQKEPAARAVPESAPPATTTAKKRTPFACQACTSGASWPSCPSASRCVPG